MPHSFVQRKTTPPSFSLRPKKLYNVGDLFVQDAIEVHDAPKEEALEDEEESEGSDDTVW